MGYKIEGTDLVISDFQKGIADSPYSGIADMRNVDITSILGEVSTAFSASSVTLPPVLNGVSYTAEASTDRLTIPNATGLYVGCAIVLASNTATGLSNATVYYVRNIVGNTFQVSLYPVSPIIDITVDGGGTLTTYQYGNQRGLTDNGAPVSYVNVPEIGGVLMVDSSNYVWFWSQESTALSASNTVLFLGNIGGIATSTDNQTGIQFFNGYVVLIQQPSTLNVLKWSTFISQFGSSWNYNNPSTAVSTLLGGSISSAIPVVSTRVLYNSATNGLPEVLYSNRTVETASATTITSPTIPALTGQTVLAFVLNYNNTAISGVTFNGNAMTLESDDNSSSPFNFGSALYSYQVPSDMTGTVVATFGGSVANRVLYTVVLEGLGTMQTTTTNNSASTTVFGGNSNVTKPNQVGFVLTFTNDDSIITYTSSLQLLDGFIISSVGQDYLYYYSGYHGEQTTLKKNVPTWVGENNTLYWGGGENSISSLNQNAGEIFSPTQDSTFTLEWEALDLPENEVVQSIEMSSGLLYVGSSKNKIYPWDTFSPSFENPILYPESGIVDFSYSNNILYSFGGNLGKINLTNQSSVSNFKDVIASVTGEEKPMFFFWDSCLGKENLYFSFQAYTNSAPTTPLATTGGVWAVSMETGAIYMIQKTVHGDYQAWVRMATQVSNGYSQTKLRPKGEGLLVGYSIGDNYYLDYSSSTPYSNYESYIETDIIPVGTYFSKHTFEHIEYKLGAPMVAGEGIRIYQRSNLNGTYVLIADFTTEGLISDQASINWENVEWVQFKIELKSTDTSPSYVRLREIRLK